MVGDSGGKGALGGEGGGCGPGDGQNGERERVVAVAGEGVKTGAGAGMAQRVAFGEMSGVYCCMMLRARVGLVGVEVGGDVVIVVAVDWRGHASCMRVRDSVDEFCADINDWLRNGWEGLVDGDWDCRGGGGNCGRLRVNLRLLIRRSCARCCSRLSRGEVVVGFGVDSGTGLASVEVVVGVLVVLVVCVH